MFGLFGGSKKSELKPKNWHPDMEVALEHMRNGNWSALSQLLAKQSNNSRFALIQSCGVNGDLGEFHMQFPQTSDADVFVGGVRTQWAWRYRGGATADHVGHDAAILFLKELKAATVHLDRALATQPDNSLAQGFKIRIAMGLNNRAECDALIARLKQCDDPPMEGLGAALQALCPKWGGSLEQLFAFARDVAQRQNIHAARYALLARAHIETWLDALMDDDASVRADYQNYLTRDDVKREIIDANSAFHVEMTENLSFQNDSFAAQFAHNNFGYALYRARQMELAATHIEALKDNPSETPWAYSFGDSISSKWAKLRKQAGLPKEIS